MAKKVIKNKNVSQRMKNIINIKIGDKIVRKARRTGQRRNIETIPMREQLIQPSIQTYKFNLGNVSDEIKAINDRSNATLKETENYTKLLELQRKTDAEKLKQSRVINENISRSKIMDMPETLIPEPITPVKEKTVSEKDETVETVNPAFIPFITDKPTLKDRIKVINKKRNEIFESKINTPTVIVEEVIPKAPVIEAVIEKPKRVLGKKISEAEQSDIIRVLGTSLKRPPTYIEFKTQIEDTYRGYQKPSATTFNKVMNMLKRNKEQPIPSPAKPEQYPQYVMSSVSSIRKSKK